MKDPDQNTDEITPSIFIVEGDNVGERLDSFISGNAPAHISRSRISSLIKDGHVSVSGKPTTKPNHRLKIDDRVELLMPPPEDPTPLPENIPLEILFEDEHLIVINKPAGLVVHPAAGNWTGTLVNALLHHCGDTLVGIGGVRRPGIVHRLDKETSGVMVVAKTDLAHRELSDQFADHGRTRGLIRSYFALCWGMPARNKGTIDAPLGRDKRNRLRRAVVNPGQPDAKQAVTHFTTREIYGDAATRTPIASLIECVLETGRTHQIRVHMAHIGHPLLGDREYGQHFKSKEAKLSATVREKVNVLGRQALHAGKLGFEHPKTGELLSFEAKMPEKLSDLIAEFKKTNE